MGRKSVQVPVACAVCKAKWTVKPSRAAQNKAITCSKECLGKLRSRNRIRHFGSEDKRTATCVACSKKFTRKPSQLAKYADNYCGRACKNADPAQIRMARLARTNGRWLPCGTCGNNVWRTPGTLQMNTYCSRPCANRDRATRGKTRPNTRGHRNWNWRGGKSIAPYSWGFGSTVKAQVRARDKNSCRLCSASPSVRRDLIVHHIDQAKNNHRLSNLILLCRPCHIRVHPPTGRPSLTVP